MPLVPAAVLDAAIAMERRMLDAPLGWGVCAPPDDVVATRLLASSGLPVALLPRCKAMPQGWREPLQAAYEDACKRFGWRCLVGLS